MYMMMWRHMLLVLLRLRRWCVWLLLLLRRRVVEQEWDGRRLWPTWRQTVIIIIATTKVCHLQRDFVLHLMMRRRLLCSKGAKRAPELLLRLCVRRPRQRCVADESIRRCRRVPTTPTTRIKHGHGSCCRRRVMVLLLVLRRQTGHVVIVVCVRVVTDDAAVGIVVFYDHCVGNIVVI